MRPMSDAERSKGAQAAVRVTSQAEVQVSSAAGQPREEQSLDWPLSHCACRRKHHQRRSLVEIPREEPSPTGSLPPRSLGQLLVDSAGTAPHCAPVCCRRVRKPTRGEKSADRCFCPPSACPTPNTSYKRGIATAAPSLSLGSSRMHKAFPESPGEGAGFSLRVAVWPPSCVPIFSLGRPRSSLSAPAVPARRSRSASTRASALRPSRRTSWRSATSRCSWTPPFQVRYGLGLWLQRGDSHSEGHLLPADAVDKHGWCEMY